MLLSGFPSCLRNDFEMLRAVRIAGHAHNHLCTLVHVVVYEHIATCALVTGQRLLALRIAGEHSCYDVACARQVRAFAGPTKDRSYEQAQDCETESDFHFRTPIRICRGTRARRY